VATTTETNVDRVHVLAAGQIEVRAATVTTIDGVEQPAVFHRHVLQPGDDLAGEDDAVVAAAGTAWTAEVLADWQAFVASTDF